MYFEEYGDRKNPTIVLMHCAGVVDTFPFLYSLSSKYHLVIPHILGTGNEVHRDFNFSKSKDEVIEIIRSLGKDKVSIIGHSLGANLTFTLVSQNEELFERVIISSPMVNQSPKIIKLLSMYITFMYRLLSSNIMGKVFAKYLKLPEERRNFFLSYWSKVTLKTWQNYFTDGVTFDMCPNFNNVKTPILLVYGTSEPKLITSSVEGMISRKPDCSVKLVKKGNHGHPILRAEEFTKTVVDFLVVRGTKVG
jgi:pimeloyl-ACP methyl ester carboxylesterase